MNTTEENRFRPQYEKMQQSLVLQGLRPKTVEAYSRAIRRLAEHFDCCPDELTTDQLKDYFAALVRSHSWSTVKVDRSGIQFFYRHVLDRPCPSPEPEPNQSPTTGIYPAVGQTVALKRPARGNGLVSRTVGFGSPPLPGAAADPLGVFVAGSQRAHA